MTSYFCNYCETEVEELEKCEECRELCEDKDVCINCLEKCDNCHKIMCIEHSLECDMCHIHMCYDCIFTCKVCNKKFCIDHRNYGDLNITEIEICTGCFKKCHLCNLDVFFLGENYNIINDNVVCTRCIGHDNLDEVERVFKRKKITHINTTDTKSELHDTSCHVCLTNKACIAFIPCGHITSCHSCTDKLIKNKKSQVKCPYCREDVDDVLRVYV
jgi:hypothetical protein